MVKGSHLLTLCELLLQKMDSKEKVNKFDLHHFLLFFDLYNFKLLEAPGAPEFPSASETAYFKVA